MFKRAFAPVFKYIFALVAGAVILLFFVKLAMNMVGTSDRLSSAETGFLFDDMLTASSVNSDSSTQIPSRPWPTPLEFSFGKGLSCGKLSFSSYQQSTQKIIFSPSTLKGVQVGAWTQSWFYPFKVANFFFLTNQDSKYFLVYSPSDAAVADFVRGIDSAAAPTDTSEHFPKSFALESIPKDQVFARLGSASKFGFVKLVFFNTAPPPNIPPSVSYVRIDYVDCEPEKNDDDCRGSVAFFNPSRNSFFMGKPMLYGAILSDDFDSYSCQLSRVYDALAMTSSIYSAKADLLALKRPSCAKYAGIRSNLDSFKSLATSKSSDYDSFQTFKDALISSNNLAGDDSACTILF